MNFARDRLALALATLAAAVALVACGTEGPSPTSVGGTGGTAATGGAPSAQAPTTVGPPPSPTPDDTTPLALDPALLAFLPATVANSPVTEDADEAAVALSDPALPRIASAVDAAAAVDTGTGNLVFAWIVQLKPTVFTDADYRQWRDAYDDGACAASGEVVGRAEATIGGRQAYVTSCAVGLHTYHVWIQNGDLLVSASSIGDGRFGELLLAGLRVPA